MSEPTYRVELSHHPENGLEVEWRAAVYSAADVEPVMGSSIYAMSLFDAYRATREDAFDAAQAWCKAKAQEPLSPSTVFLTEDGDILDRHEVER